MNMEVLSRTAQTNLLLLNGDRMDISRSPDHSFDAQDGTIMWDAEAQGVNKKLMRLAVDSRTSTKRTSGMFDESAPKINREKMSIKVTNNEDVVMTSMKMKSLSDTEDARFPRMEEMSHFHYNNVEFSGSIAAALILDEGEDISTLDTGQGLLVEVSSCGKSWVVKRSQEDFIGLDNQIHRCLYSRKYSKLPPLKEFELGTKLTPSMVQQLQFYLSRFSDVAGNNVNCGPILNWLELDNHGNHLVVMEADDSAINVPAVAAGRVIKRYQAQASDEMTLEVGDLLSVIDMPPVEETIWWRGKKGYEVGFFPSHCIEILREKEINEQIIAHLQARPISKRRGKFISFLRFFFKSRPSKDELMQHGILRERVFGCDLGERLAHTGLDIPSVLQLCAEVIEEHGIVDGIYRLSGIMSNLQRLRVSFDNDDEPPNLRDMRYLNDIHCISSLLKTYFRELPNPLFTYELYEKFVLAIKKDDDTEKTVAFHHVIQRLPPPHYRTMNYLLRHLNLCASKADETNMTEKNLAIVWAPNLLRPPSDDSILALTEFRTQAIIVEYMIRNVDVFFDNNLASAAIAYYPEVPEAEEVGTIARSATISTGPKLISLEEARQRVFPHRKVSESISLEGSTSNSPRHKLRSASIPPKVAATPISPQPTLLSLEEAQARTKLKFNPNRRGSADLMQIRNSMNSPKRSKKWFGLFSKAKTDSASEEDSITTYRKKTSVKNIQHLGAPTRSQSEYRLQDIPKKQTLGNIPRVMSLDSQPEEKRELSAASVESLHYNFKASDGDDSSLMSAVVSVTAKYIDIGHARKNSTTQPVSSVELHRNSATSSNNDLRRKSNRSSFAIGEPTDFRRLDDIDLRVAPPRNVVVKSDFVKVTEKIPKLDADSHYKGKHTPSDSHDSGYLSQTNITNNSTMLQNDSKDTSSPTTPSPTISPERKHQRQRSTIDTSRDLDENVPSKKIRSLSPENYNLQSRVNKETKDFTRPRSHSEYSNDGTQFISSKTAISQYVQPGTKNNQYIEHNRTSSNLELSTPASITTVNYVNMKINESLSTSAVSRKNRISSPPITTTTEATSAVSRKNRISSPPITTTTEATSAVSKKNRISSPPITTTTEATFAVSRKNCISSPPITTTTEAISAVSRRNRISSPPITTTTEATSAVSKKNRISSPPITTTTEATFAVSRKNCISSPPITTTTEATFAVSRKNRISSPPDTIKKVEDESSNNDQSHLQKSNRSSAEVPASAYPKHVHVALEDAQRHQYDVEARVHNTPNKSGQYFDSLVKRTEENIKYGSNDSLLKKNYDNLAKNIYVNAEEGGLVKSTRDRLSPTFNADETSDGSSYVMNQNQVHVKGDTSRDHGAYHSKSRDETRELTHTRYVNIEKVGNHSSTSLDDDSRPRSRSVKERAVMFGSDSRNLYKNNNDLLSSQPDLSQTSPLPSYHHEQTRSSPNLIVRSEPITKQPHIGKLSRLENKNPIPKYVNTNRHSSYIPQRYDTEEFLSYNTNRDNKYPSHRLQASSVPRLNIVSHVPRSNIRAESHKFLPANDGLVLSTKTRTDVPPSRKQLAGDEIKGPRDYINDHDITRGADLRRNTHSDSRTRNKRTESTRPISMDYSAISSADYRSHQVTDHPHHNSGNYRSHNVHRNQRSSLDDFHPHYISGDYRTHNSSSSLTSARSHPHIFSTFQKSSSDHNLGDGKQIGSFPLTLKSGSNSERNSGLDVDSSRPLSSYDNDRKSYYDNVNNIHYEML